MREKTTPITFRIYNDQIYLLQKAEIKLGKGRAEILRELLGKFFAENEITYDSNEIYNLVSFFKKTGNDKIPYTFAELLAVVHMPELPDGLMEVPDGLIIHSWEAFLKWCNRA